MTAPIDEGRLLEVLTDARGLGFLGPGPVSQHVERSLGFLSLLPQTVRKALDLGSGAGVPGLVLACALPECSWVLVDSNRKRAQFLGDKIAALGLQERVTVVGDRAEEVGRGPLRAKCDAVVARSFAGPGTTAECAAPLLRVGGILVVADPPGGAPERWPADRLAVLGLEPAGVVSHPLALSRFIQKEPCPERYPRRIGIPEKRPLF